MLAGLWLAWTAAIEPRWLCVRTYWLGPGAGPRPGPPVGEGTEGPPPARLPEGSPVRGRGSVRIAHLTDLHAPVYRIDESRILSSLSAWEPHLIAFTGDLAEGGGLPYDAGLRLLARLAARWPVYFVPGNHDHLAGWQTMEQRLREAGVRVLVNEGECATVGGLPLFIAGVDDPHTGRDRLDEALAGAPSAAAILLLAHAPSQRLRRLAVERRIPLVLVGHTHGGQVRLPAVGALWVPGQGWFPHYDRGWFRLGDGYLFVNSGLGTPKPWIRWLCPPEVVLIQWEPGG
ncbi:MAG: metallophosphoesterase [Bacillota bacterium]|nr:MAG: metallophosphoesterase [Bacillota bacterium]